MTPQELKNSILQLAIQGKMVEQRPEEGTAEELHQHIQSEKQRLIKAGTIKKEKPLPEITEDEKLFDIPENWKWARLNSLTLFIKAGGDKPKDFSEDKTETHTVPVIANGIQNDGIIGYTRVATVDEPCITVSGRGTIGFSCIRTEPFCPIVRLLVLNISKEVYQEYIQIVLTALLERGVGTSIQQLTVPMLEPKLIPVPPLAEQKRIVAKIKELLPYIDRYEQAWSKLEDFNKRFPADMQKSILQIAIQGKLVEQRSEEGTGEELYQQIQAEKQRLIKAGTIKKEKPLPEIKEEEKPYDIPENWTWVRLSDICNVSDGTHQTPTYVERGMPFISAQNVKPYRFIPQNYRYVSEADYEMYNKNIAPEKGDILMTRVGAGIGEAAIIDVDMCFSIYVSLTLIKCYKNDYDMKYLLYVLNSPLGRQLAKKKTLGKGASQGNLNLIFIREFLFPLPPYAEQKRIVAKLEELLPLCEKLK